MKYIRLILLWVKNLFEFKEPFFEHFEYVDYVEEDTGYLIFSWRMKNAYCLKVKRMDFVSLLKTGSAYIAIPVIEKELEVVVSNSWRSKTYPLELKRIVLDVQTKFALQMQNSFKAQVNIFYPVRKFSKIEVSPFKVQLLKQKSIKAIINIFYSN